MHPFSWHCESLLVPSALIVSSVNWASEIQRLRVGTWQERSHSAKQVPLFCRQNSCPMPAQECAHSNNQKAGRTRASQTPSGPRITANRLRVRGLARCMPIRICLHAKRVAGQQCLGTRSQQARANSSTAETHSKAGSRAALGLGDAAHKPRRVRELCVNHRGKGVIRVFRRRRKDRYGCHVASDRRIGPRARHTFGSTREALACCCGCGFCVGSLSTHRRRKAGRSRGPSQA